jgi:hypothetical protein
MKRVNGWIAVVGVSIFGGLTAMGADQPGEISQEWKRAMAQVGCHFEQNTGQLPQAADFTYRRSDYRLDLERKGMLLALPGNGKILGGDMGIEFVEAKAGKKLPGIGQLPFKVMQRPVVNGVRRGLTAVSTFSEVSADQIFEGVDIRYKLNKDCVQFDFHVGAGADPDQIRMAFLGEESISIGNEGQITIQYPVAQIIQQPPYAFQEIEGERRYG